MAAGVAVCLIAVALVGQVHLDPRVRAVVLAVIPGLCFAVHAGRQTEGLATRRFRVAFTEALATFQTRREMPVVIGNDAQFVELSHDDAERRLSNCYFVYDAFPSRRTNVDRAVAGLSLVMPLKILTFARLRAQHLVFAVVGEEITAVVQRSVADGALLAGWCAWRKLAIQPPRPERNDGT